VRLEGILEELRFGTAGVVVADIHCRKLNEPPATITTCSVDRSFIWPTPTVRWEYEKSGSSQRLSPLRRGQRRSYHMARRARPRGRQRTRQHLPPSPLPRA
ncbi:unnamed protein product, partial [Ectocarpus sp. 12 AP-2014]